MSLSAADLLKALRIKHRSHAVVHEVVIDDTQQHAVYNKWKQEAHPNIYTDQHFADRGDEVADSVPPGWTPGKFQRRIDALIFEGNRSLTAVEIKVSRVDFFRDTPEKRGPWQAVTNRFIYLTPSGLVQPHEVPEDCGLWEVDPLKFSTKGYRTHGITSVKRAKVNKNPSPLPNQVLTSLAYRLSNYAAKGIEV